MLIGLAAGLPAAAGGLRRWHVPEVHRGRVLRLRRAAQLCFGAALTAVVRAALPVLVLAQFTLGFWAGMLWAGRALVVGAAGAWAQLVADEAAAIVLTERHRFGRAAAKPGTPLEATLDQALAALLAALSRPASPLLELLAFQVREERIRLFGASGGGCSEGEGGRCFHL